jgi:hypothetical protein
MDPFLNFFSCITDELILLIAGYLIYFIVSRISQFIRKLRGNPDKYWDKYWAAKSFAEEEKLKDPSYKAQKVWNEQEERYRESQRQMVRELITATGRYQHRTRHTNKEILRKIYAEEWPFSKWMLSEYLDGSLLGKEPSPADRIRKRIGETIIKISNN